MGLIHSRAAKKRNKAAAKLLREQAKTVRDGRREQARAARKGLASPVSPAPSLEPSCEPSCEIMEKTP
jgi:hypothetical protein